MTYAAASLLAERYVMCINATKTHNKNRSLNSLNGYDIANEVTIRHFELYFVSGEIYSIYYTSLVLVYNINTKF